MLTQLDALRSTPRVNIRDSFCLPNCDTHDEWGRTRKCGKTKLLGKLDEAKTWDMMSRDAFVLRLISLLPRSTHIFLLRGSTKTDVRRDFHFSSHVWVCFLFVSELKNIGSRENGGAWGCVRVWVHLGVSERIYTQSNRIGESLLRIFTRNTWLYIHSQTYTHADSHYAHTHTQTLHTRVTYRNTRSHPALTVRA